MFVKGKLINKRVEKDKNNLKKHVKKSLGEIKERKKILHARIKRSKKHRLRPFTPFISSAPLISFSYIPLTFYIEIVSNIGTLIVLL